MPISSSTKYLQEKYQRSGAFQTISDTAMNTIKGTILCQYIRSIDWSQRSNLQVVDQIDPQTKERLSEIAKYFFLTNNATIQRLFRWSKIHKKNQNSEVFHQLLSFGSLIGCPFLLSQKLFHPKDTIKVQATSKWLIGFSDRYRKFLWDLSHWKMMP